MGALRMALAAAIAGAVAAPSAQQVFRTGVDLVHFTVTAVDRKGGLVTSLTQDDFEILEDGRKQAIEYFARGDDPEHAPELHLGLLFDTSGSMGQDVKMSRTAAVKFLNALPDAEDMTLVDFDTEVRVTRYGQADFARMVERIRKRQPDGWTAFYDAIGVYLDGAHGQTGRKVLVLYTDGGDTKSALNYPDMLNLVKASDVIVYAIGFLEHQGQLTPRPADAPPADCRAHGRPGLLPEPGRRARRHVRAQSSKICAGTTRWAIPRPTIEATAPGARSRFV